jgi:Transposase IS116/IS110/IS902 family
MPGLGLILGARVLGEFGDEPRFPDAASRRAYAGSAPIIRASGKLKLVLLRRACNHWLAQTCRWWAFTAIRRSPDAQAYYRGTNDRVLILLPDGPDFGPAFDGVIHHGAVPLTVNPLLPAHDIMDLAAAGSPANPGHARHHRCTRRARHQTTPSVSLKRRFPWGERPR